MFSRLCKNSIFPSSNTNNSSESSNRNEYRVLPSATVPIQLNRRQLPSIPISHINSSLNFIHREPPPSYQSAIQSESRRKNISQRQRPTPIISVRSRVVRSRVEEFRNRLSVSDSDSDNGQQQQQQHQPRPQPPTRMRHNLLRNKNEILLDEDLFCPDLVRNCKSLPVVDDDDDDDEQDYQEIDELTAQLSLHNEVGLPNIKETKINHHQQHSSAIMGQNLVSLKRPKISLTWVLREQQQQQQQQQSQQQPTHHQASSNSIKSFNWNAKSNEKTLFKKKSKSNEKLFSEKLYSENNLNNFRAAKKLSDGKKLQSNDACKSEKIKKFRDNCCSRQQRESPDDINNYDRLSEGIKVKSLSQANLTVKNNCSDPQQIYVTSAQSDSGVNRRYRRRRKKSAKFGYNITNVNEFLSKCSLSNPANIPVVLSNAAILYQTRTGNQIETPLPLGMILNSIFKNQSWLYVQTPHGEEGYVNFNVCLPLGIIQRPHSAATAKCWETNTDIFPNPCGFQTDSEKELQIHGGTRSEGRRTPKLKRSSPSRTCSEKYLDSLYLNLVASQPKIIEHNYAQLKPTNKCKVTNFNNFDKLNGDYVQLKHNQEKINLNVNSKRQMLLAIIEDFSSDMISVKRGDVVKLLACKEYEDKLWYFVKSKDGCECYIPSSVASEFL